jgi:RNA polymerase sigma factor (sigma-70 family)
MRQKCFHFQIPSLLSTNRRLLAARGSLDSAETLQGKQSCLSLETFARKLCKLFHCGQTNVLDAEFRLDEMTPVSVGPQRGEVAANVTPSSDAETRRHKLEQEYDRIWNEFGASLGRLARSYESQAQAREDLLQEMHLAIWTALPRFRVESSLRTFVFRIAHNRALTHVWKKKRTGFSEPAEGLPDPRKSPEGTAIQRVDQSRLLDAICLLPIPFRQVLTLALEDLPHSEIAAVLGISESNVAVRMNRARKLLKERLGRR